MTGGALLGVAHVGYIFALEHAGIRFRAIGGTSAGALAAVLLAGLRTKPDAPAGRKLLDLLLGMPVPKFKDGKLLDRRVGDAILSLMTDLPSSPWKWLMLPAFPVALGVAAGRHPSRGCPRGLGARTACCKWSRHAGRFEGEVRPE